MKFAENLWLESIASRAKLVTVANYSAAVYGNAALQGWHLGLTAPLVFWSAMSRAVDGRAANAETAPIGAAPKAEPVANVVVLKPVATAAPVAAKPAPLAKAPATPKAVKVAVTAKPAEAPKSAVVAAALVATKPAISAKKTAIPTPVEAAPVAKAFVAPTPAPAVKPAPAKNAAKPIAAAKAPATTLAPKPANGLVRVDAPRDGKADDLTRVRGIGSKLSADLNKVGIYHFDQIAGLNRDGVAALDKVLPGFKRICARFDLVAGSSIFA